MSARRATYSEALTSDKDRVRFLLEDTGTDGGFLFSDEEITGALGMVPSGITTTPERHYAAAAHCATGLAMRYAREAGSTSDQQRAQDLSQRATEMREMAAQLRDQAGTGGMPIIQVVRLAEPPSSPSYIETS